jgi:indole-3-glycerol phosphate synthase
LWAFCRVRKEGSGIEEVVDSFDRRKKMSYNLNRIRRIRFPVVITFHEAFPPFLALLYYDRTHMYKGIEIIAEVKTDSPFGYRSSESWKDLFDLAVSVGDIVSIHTDPRWGGSFELLRKARRLTSIPILAKGIHATDAEVEEAIAAGAEYVLVVGRVPRVHKERCLIEPYTLRELSTLPADARAVWNSRDLGTGGMKDEMFDDARKIWKGWLCQASNIRTVADIEDGADAVLVGTHLRSFAESLT